MISTLTLFAVVLATMLAATLAAIILDVRESRRHIRVKIEDRHGFYG